ncbi:MAG: hypothetical protein Kow0080_33300 [Candidatus Promineifilaceae bacterium]
MTKLHLEFLGQPRIYFENQPPIELHSEKWLALLAYLAVTGETFTRPQLEALLWSESPPEKAQTSLRTAVYNINKQLKTIHTSRKAVWFAPETDYTLDLCQVQKNLAQGDSSSLTNGRFPLPRRLPGWTHRGRCARI